MADVIQENKSRCMQQCEVGFVQYTAQHRVGGVESLRICRETCHGKGSAMASADRQNASGN